MNAKPLLLLAGGFARHPRQSAYALAPRKSNSAPKLEDCIRMGAGWLLKAQENCPDGNGYSRKFSLALGWDRGYIETTGYIIPTLFDVARCLGDGEYRESALAAGDWLLAVQTAEGAFTDIDSRQPMVFDTGQVMLGLNRLHRETGDPRFLAAAYKAGAWLCKIQDSDGAWRRFAYKGGPHSYYSRVGAAMVETGQLAGEPIFVEVGRRNLDWALRQEQPNGWFRHCAFRASEPALLHTIVYVLEGLLMGAELLSDVRYSGAALRGAGALFRLRDAEGLLHARYGEDWRVADDARCVTGLAQYVGVCFDAARLSDDGALAEAGWRILDHLCGWQCRKGADITGALPSSIPLWGGYGCMAYYNWNVKFFLDAVMKAESYGRQA